MRRLLAAALVLAALVAGALARPPAGPAGAQAPALADEVKGLGGNG